MMALLYCLFFYNFIPVELEANAQEKGENKDSSASL